MLRRRSIRLRIIVLVLVPVVALLGLYAEVLNLTLGNVLTLKQEAAIRQLVALPVADVQNQLAKERTLALAVPGQARARRPHLLLKQEAKTDVAIKELPRRRADRAEERPGAEGTAGIPVLAGSPRQDERAPHIAWSASASARSTPPAPTAPC